MKNKYRARVSWIFATALVVAVLTVITIAVLRWQAEYSRRTQAVLGELESQAHRIERLELRAIAEGRVTPLLRAQLDQTRRDVRRLVAELPAEDGTEHLADLERRYVDAIDAELALVAGGRLAEAKRFKADQVDVRAAAYGQALSTAHTNRSELTERSIGAADVGSAVTAVAALTIMSLLLWQFDKTRREVETGEVEKRALEASEERFRGLVQNASDVTMILDSAATVSYVSASARGVLGFEPEQLVGARLFDLAHPDDGDELQRWLARCLDDPDRTCLVEFRFAHTDGDWRHFEAVGNNQLDHAAVGGVVANVRDVTARKRAETQLSRQRAQLEERNSELLALQDVSEVVSRATSLDELLAQVLRTIARIDIFRGCAVGGIITVEGETMRLASYVGSPSEAFLRVHENMRLGDCLCGLAARTGELLISANCEHDKRHTLRYPGMTPHGHVIVPLRGMDRVVGVLYFYLVVGTHVDVRTRQTLLAVGDQVGTAIENVRLYERTRELSLHDPLTGLANRRLMHITLDENFARARRLGRPFSIVMMDLDHFKCYNDAHGHGAGDMLLAEVAKLILKQVREIDLAVRYGGEEFLVLLPEAEGDDAADVAERIRHVVMGAEFFHAEDMSPSHITVSLGVASYADAMPSGAELVARADEAMYEAKKQGRNRVVVWNSQYPRSLA